MADGRPEHLREAVRRQPAPARLERIDLFQLHRIDPKVPLDDQIGALVELQGEGKIRHIGLSEVTVEQIETAAGGRADRLGAEPLQPRRPAAEDVLEHCERENIGFIPWFPLATGDLAKAGGPLARGASSSAPRRPARAGLAAAALARDAADPGNVLGRAPRGEHRRRRPPIGRFDHGGVGVQATGPVRRVGLPGA